MCEGCRWDVKSGANKGFGTDAVFGVAAVWVLDIINVML